LAFFRIVLGAVLGAEVLIVAEHPARDRALFWHGQVAIDQHQGGLDIRCMGHGLTHALIVEGRPVDRKVPEHVLAGVFRDDDVHLAGGLQRFHIVQRRFGDLDLARLEPASRVCALGTAVTISRSM
jgi:hypothetical protein